MHFTPGQSGNPAGRPRGTRERVEIPVRVQKNLVKALTTRALEEQDAAAQEILALWLIFSGTPHPN